MTGPLMTGLLWTGNVRTSQDRRGQGKTGFTVIIMQVSVQIGLNLTGLELSLAIYNYKRRFCRSLFRLKRASPHHAKYISKKTSKKTKKRFELVHQIVAMAIRTTNTKKTI